MYVYVIGAARGPKKVGCARDVDARLRQFQTAYHRPLSVLFSVAVPDETCSAIERRAHWLLQSSRAEGEWFKVGAKEAIEAVRQAAEENGAGELARPSVGRPPMNLKPTLVRLPQDVAERIDAIAGPNRRAEFIREAIDRELKRREKKASASE